MTQQDTEHRTGNGGRYSGHREGSGRPRRDDHGRDGHAGGRYGGARGRSDRGPGKKPYGDGSGKRPHKDGDRGSGDRDRPRGGRKPYDKGRPGDDRRGSRGDRPERRYDGRSGDRGGKRPYDRDGPREKRDHDRSNDDRRDGGNPREAPREAPAETRLTIPSTPQKVLFKGVDCEVNGKNTLALILYLHGAAMLSEGCENNALRMLRDMGPGEFPTVRGRISGSCTEDAMTVFDYLCLQVDPASPRPVLDSAFASGSPLATYLRIRMEEIEGDDPAVDAFAARHIGNEAMVEKGLKLLVRKKDSARAEAHLKEIDARKRLRQTVNQEFVRATKGDGPSLKRLEELAETFPEAGFLRGYLDCQDREMYIREGMDAFSGTVMSLIPYLGISDTPYGMYLAAKRLQGEGEEWIHPMIRAAASGSEDALDELRPVQTRRDVRSALMSAYLTRGDTANLVRLYDGEDATYLDRYCGKDPAKVIEVGRLLRGTREIDWLRRNCLDGVEECRDALVSMASQEDRRCKQLVYALHDIGAEKESARLYMDMYGDRTLPSVKWLSKVCADEEARELVRARFEEMGDMRTFESIFVDDGYDAEHRNRKKGSGGRGGGKGYKGGRGRR